MTPAKTPPSLPTLVFLAATTVMSLNLFLPALPELARSLGTDYATASWAISGYLAATGIVQLVAGPLSDRIGRRPVVLTSLLIFTFASVGCALSGDMSTFLTFRLAQSVAISGFSMSLAIIIDTTEKSAATAKIGTISAAVAAIPMISPVIGGVLTELFGWRSCFWLYAILGLALFTATYLDLGETRKTNRSGDKPDRGRLLRNRRFWGFAACIAFSIGAFYIFLTGAPLVATEVFGISSGVLGGIIGSITVGYLIGSTTTARIGARFGPMPLIVAGRSVACIGLAVGLCAVLLGVENPVVYFASTACVGIGNGLTTPGANASALSVDPDAAGAAAGISGALTVFVGAIITGFAGTALHLGPPEALLLALMLTSSAIAFAALLLTRGQNQTAE